MEFTINNVLLLDEVRKLWTKRISMFIPMEKVDEVFVSFIERNVKTNPGSTELYISVADPDTNYHVRLKTQTLKLQLNDEMVQFLQETDYIKYTMDKV